MEPHCIKCENDKCTCKKNVELRKVELWKDDQWNVVRMIDLKKGDKFKLTEVDGSWSNIYIADSDGEYNEEKYGSKNAGVVVIPLENYEKGKQ